MNEYIRKSKMPRGTLKAAKNLIERDTLIPYGLSLTEMGSMAGITRAGFHDYLKRTGQLEEWKDVRKKQKVEKSKLRESRKRVPFYPIPNHFYCNAERGIFAYQKAIEYYDAMKGTSQIPPDSLVRMLELYESKVDKEEVIRYKELGRLSGIKRDTVKKVLETLCLI